MRIALLLLLSAFLIAGCSKMEDKKPVQQDNKQQTNTPNPHGNMPPAGDQQQMTNDKTDMASEDAVDKEADKLSKEAFDFESTFKKDNSDANKKKLAEMHLAAGNYLMFKANLNPKKKYGPALKHYRRVLELDPKNQEAMANKQQIEDIYTSMGRPIPN